MFFLSGTLTLTNGSTISGAAIKDSPSLRYVGNDMYAANAGLAELVTAQDLVVRLYNGNDAFYNFINALITAGLGITANARSSDSVIRDSVWQFSALLPSGEYLYVLGSSTEESPTIRSSSLATAVGLLAADSDFLSLINGVAS
jgi:hypothetical protein